MKFDTDDLSPRYHYRPIASIDSLAAALNIPKAHLIKTATKANHLYREVPQTKKDGSIRMTYDARPSLKIIHDRIVRRILWNVQFPSYLHGGIRDKASPRDPFSNAAVHANAKHLISEDIKDFFPSLGDATVYDIWKRCLNFPPAVAKLLTTLTTLNGIVPQGAKTSSYLANLAFWDVEPTLVLRLRSMELNYSRFVDDVCISSNQPLSVESKTEVIQQVYGMLAAKQCKPKRSKHKIQKSGQRLEVTGLVVNGGKPAISKPERKRIRAAVNALCRSVKNGSINEETASQYRSTRGRVTRLIVSGHPDGNILKVKLDQMKNIFSATAAKPSPTFEVTLEQQHDLNVPPWE